MKHYTVRNVKIDGLKLLILQPTANRKAKEKTPGILWIHDGGYAVGMASMIYCPAPSIWSGNTAPEW